MRVTNQGLKGFYIKQVFILRIMKCRNLHYYGSVNYFSTKPMASFAFVMNPMTSLRATDAAVMKLMSVRVSRLILNLKKLA